MSTELAVGITAAAFVLMVGITFGFGAVVLLDAITIWPPRRRKSPAVRYYAHPSVIDTEGRWAS